MSLAIAQQYASLGWLVIPVEGKRPVGFEWQKRATSNQADVAPLFSCSHDGIGVLLGQRSGLIDFDCDSPEAEAAIGRLFEGVEIETPFYQSTRGKHYLFQWSARVPGDSIKIVVDGLEIRTGNGDKGCQSVFPPSGGRSWLTSPEECPVAEIPEIVLERIEKLYADTHRPKKIFPQAVTAVFAGSQSENALDVPRWLAKHGRDIIGRTDGSDGTTRWHVECPNLAAHTTDNSWRDCCVTQSATGVLGGSCFHSSCGMGSWPTLRDAIGGLTYADYHEQPDNTGIILAGILNEDFEIVPVMANPITVIEDDEDENDDTPIGEALLNFPDDCLRPPGLIGEFIDYVLGTAKYPQPEHTLAAGLALMSLVTGRRVADESGTRGNLMIVGLGPTRSGKEHPRHIIKTILEVCAAEGMYEEKCASEASLYGFLKQSPSGIFINDEFGDWMATARSKTGANTQPARILTAMTMLYSSSQGRFKAPRYADNAKQVEIDQPHLVLYATSTGEVFWKNVTPEYLSGGLFGRIMLFENRGYVDPMPMAGRDKPLPESIVFEIRQWFQCYANRGDLSWEHPKPFIVPHAADALERFEAHELSIAKRRKGESAIKAALWSGCAEITAKIALLLSCSRSRNPFLIKLEDVERAIRLSNWLTRRKIGLAMDHVSENATEDASKRVYRMIKESGKKGLTKNELTRKTQWLKARDRDELLANLQACRTVVLGDVQTKTKTKTVFVASCVLKGIV